MSELWHLRIHLFEGIDSTELYTFVSKRCEVIVCVFEQHDNRPHLHILFKETKITQSTVIQNLKKEYSMIKGNGAYSCQKTDKMKKKKVGNDEKAKAYVCKGEYHGYDISSNPIVIGTPTIDVKHYHDKFWEVNEATKDEYQPNGSENSKDCFLKPKAKTKTWMDKVKDEIFDKYSVECNTMRTYVRDTKPSDELFKTYKLSYRTVFCHYYKSYGKLVKGFDENVIRKNWNGIHDSILAVDDEVHTIKANKVFSGMFPHLS